MSHRGLNVFSVTLLLLVVQTIVLPLTHAQRHRRQRRHREVVFAQAAAAPVVVAEPTPPPSEPAQAPVLVTGPQRAEDSLQERYDAAHRAYEERSVLSFRAGVGFGTMTLRDRSTNEMDFDAALTVNGSAGVRFANWNAINFFASYRPLLSLSLDNDVLISAHHVELAINSVFRRGPFGAIGAGFSWISAGRNQSTIFSMSGEIGYQHDWFTVSLLIGGDFLADGRPLTTTSIAIGVTNF